MCRLDTPKNKRSWNDEVVREGEVLEVSLHLELHLTARVRIGLEASLREVKDVSELPSVLATALKQWFAEVVDVSS
jgi:hypothetical protein